MIEVSTDGFVAFAGRLAGRARTVAEVRAKTTLRETQRDPWRWRDARLLWPDITQEP